MLRLVRMSPDIVIDEKVCIVMCIIKCMFVCTLLEMIANCLCTTSIY